MNAYRYDYDGHAVTLDYAPVNGEWIGATPLTCNAWASLEQAIRQLRDGRAASIEITPEAQTAMESVPIPKGITFV